MPVPWSCTCPHDPSEQRDECSFLTFWATLVCVEVLGDAAFRAIGAAARTSIKATMATYFYIFINLLASNKPILYHQIPIWWRWAVWLLPLWYATTGVGNNEFLGSSYSGHGEVAPVLVPEGVGVAWLQQIDIKIASYWRCAQATLHLCAL